jgi:hypothetical protein
MKKVHVVVGEEMAKSSSVRRAFRVGDQQRHFSMASQRE